MTGVVPALRRANVAALTPVTLSLVVAVMFAVRLTRVAPAAGDVDDTVGLGPVVNAQDVGASGLPARSVMPAVRFAVCRLSPARVGVGFSVATRVAAFQLTGAAMMAPAAFFRVKRAAFRPAMGSLNVAVTFEVWLTPVVFRAGALAVMTGAVVSTVTARAPVPRVSVP